MTHVSITSCKLLKSRRAPLSRNPPFHFPLSPPPPRLNCTLFFRNSSLRSDLLFTVLIRSIFYGWVITLGKLLLKSQKVEFDLKLIRKKVFTSAAAGPFTHIFSSRLQELSLLPKKGAQLAKFKFIKQICSTVKIFNSGVKYFHSLKIKFTLNSTPEVTLPTGTFTPNIWSYWVNYLDIAQNL